MSKKSWKDHLLSSGLPLEHSIIQELKQSQFLTPREFRYERKNEYGVSTTFSVDIHATKIFSENKLWLDLLIECKYRYESTKWIFNPDEYDWFFGVEFHESFIVLDTLTKPRKLNRNYLDKFADSYPLCAKGIEIIDNDSNPKSIDQAIAQLAYAVPNMVVSCLDFQATEEDPYIHIIIPIIITTAELWRLRPEVTISDIRNAQDLHDLADNRDVLVIYKEPDNKLSQYTDNVLSDQIGKVAKNKIDDMSSTGYQSFKSIFSNSTPNIYVVIHYSRFSQAINNLLRFLGSNSLMSNGE